MNHTVKISNIGAFKDVPVIDILIKPGDSVTAKTPLITLESDKATMDIPAPCAGETEKVLLKLGDRVAEGCGVVTAPLSL